MNDRRSTSRRRFRVGAPALAAIAAVAAVGCTMCPDPFDYSGPVPNGSSPQNDFRARSGGILPLGAAARPWPPVVTTHGETPGDAGESARPVLAETDDWLPDDRTDVRQTGGIIDGTGFEPEPEPEPAATLETVLDDAATAEAERPVAVRDPPTSPEVPFQGRDTPGWRPKRP